MTQFLQPSFSVGLGSEAYRQNHEATFQTQPVDPFLGCGHRRSWAGPDGRCTICPPREVHGHGCDGTKDQRLCERISDECRICRQSVRLCQIAVVNDHGVAHADCPLPEEEYVAPSVRKLQGKPGQIWKTAHGRHVTLKAFIENRPDGEIWTQVDGGPVVIPGGHTLLKDV